MKKIQLFEKKVELFVLYFYFIVGVIVHHLVREKVTRNIFPSELPWFL